MSARQIQTILSGAGLAQDATGEWKFVTSKQLLLTCFDDDDFASGVGVEYDLSDEPLADGQTDPNDPAPTQFAPMKDSNGTTVQVTEPRSDIPLAFVANLYRMRARVVGGDGNTLIHTRLNANN
jgi:hypothetical protein